MNGLLDAVFGSGDGLVVVVLCALRLLPIAFLSPVFGGMTLPSVVRLGLVLTFALALKLGGELPAPAYESFVDLVPAAANELLLGVAIGAMAGLPFEMSRTTGRFIDLFRGASAEVVQPGTGSRESASGELLHQWLLALVVTGTTFSLLFAAIWRTFAAVGLGVSVDRASMAELLLVLVTGSFAAALAMAAPVAALSLVIDVARSMLKRVVPAIGSPAISTNVRILGGAILLWAALGVLGHRLLDEVVRAVETISEVGPRT